MEDLFQVDKLCYIIQNNYILDNITCTLPKNKLTTIVGASGSGKSSFLKILSGRVKTGVVSGNIIYNNCVFDNEYIKNNSNILYQQDLLYENLTVYEYLKVCAQLKTFKCIDEIENKINYILDLLELKYCKDRLIGNQLSGGEKRRVSIAIELLGEPEIIFMDEPTSGLDSYNAYNIIQILKKLTRQGINIICIIHQPSKNIVDLLEYLIFLDKGKILYKGFISEIHGHFCDKNIIIPLSSNPIDYILIHIIKDIDKVNKLIYNESELIIDDDLDTLNYKIIHKPTYKQFLILTKREFKNVVRNKYLILSKLIRTLFIGIFISIIYHKIEFNQIDIQNRSGLLFFLSINSLMGYVYTTINLFIKNKIIFTKEYDSNWYKLAPYYLSSIVADYPLLLSLPLLTSLIIYFIVGLQKKFLNFITFAFIITISSFCGTSIGILIGTIFNKIEPAITITPAIILPLIIFSGFFINNNSIPRYLFWLSYLSPIKYTFHALILNEFSGLKFNCLENEYDIINGTKICPYTTGEEYIESLNFSKSLTIGINIIILSFMYVIFIILGYLIFRYKAKYNNKINYKFWNK